ncbi:MAG: hypothetical protein ACRCU1_03490 [Alsobacter sp.]
MSVEISNQVPRDHNNKASHEDVRKECGGERRIMTPPRPSPSSRTLVGIDAPEYVDHGIPREERETPNEGTDLSDMQMLGPMGPPEAVQHLCVRLGALDGRLKYSVSEMLHQRQIIERAAEQSKRGTEQARQATVTADNTLTRLLEEIGPMKASLARVGDALFQLLSLPQSLAELGRAVVDLQRAVVRLDERMSRAERRGDSHSEIVDRVASLHIEDETTEVKARSLAIMRAHEQRTAALGIVKRIAKWLFAGGGAALLGAAIARGCGG